MAPLQLSLLGNELPDGFVYEPKFLTKDEERELLEVFATLPFEAFDYHGYKANRRIVKYGWEYNFTSNLTTQAPPVPEYLQNVRDKAARFAKIEAHQLEQAAITEYPPGAPIGWHRDVPHFETIIGISLASSCRMRLRPYQREGQTFSLELEPRSAYIISGESRWGYQHSIPAVERLRYSITFRTVRSKVKRVPA